MQYLMAGFSVCVYLNQGDKWNDDLSQIIWKPCMGHTGWSLSAFGFPHVGSPDVTAPYSSALFRAFPTNECYATT
jgi:hypothetical protein